MLESFNRKYLDEKADRYFAVSDPVEIEIDGLPEKVEELLHPDHPERGKRIIPVSKKVYVSKEDFQRYKGKKVRLVGLCNITLKKKCKNEGTQIVREIPKIHWVSEPNVRIKVLMNNGRVLEMIAEPDIAKAGEYAQLVRFGFVKLESKEEMSFIFTHR
jgi:glutamyl-tRNA synthetase